jgi:uncharacterized protein YndB with AHSA1/START domain
MEDSHFTAEFEFKASQKMLFSYMNSPTGLAQWFADDVIVTEDKTLIFFWDEEQHKAKIASQRLNKYIKFEFLNGEDNNLSSNGNGETPFIEIDLDSNELTGTVFMRVTDTATISDDSEELREIWQYLTDSLKEIVGG